MAKTDLNFLNLLFLFIYTKKAKLFFFIFFQFLLNLNDVYKYSYKLSGSQLLCHEYDWIKMTIFCNMLTN